MLDDKEPGFPALERAKQRFLARQKQQPAQSVEPTVFPEASSMRGAVSWSTPSRYEALFEDLCATVESDLIAIAQQIKAVSISVRSEYQPLVTDLDQLTSVLLNADAATTLRPLRISDRSKPQPTATSTTELKHCKSAKKGLRSAPQRRPKKPDAAAKVLQACVRRYLYGVLYPKGSAQLVQAQRLRQRAQIARFWSHWGVFRAQRQRFRSTCAKVRQRWQRRSTRWAQARAQSLLPTDGKYAMAKEFHRSKLLVRVFHEWLGHATQTKALN